MSPLFPYYLLVIGIGCLIGLVRINKLTRPFQYLLALLAYSLFSEIISRICKRDLGEMDPVYHIYAVISFTLYSLFFYETLKSYPILRLVLKVGLILIIPATLINAAEFENLTLLPSNIIIPSFFLLSIYSIIIFFHLLKTPNHTSIFKNPLFWFAAGTMLYSAASFMLLGFDRILLSRMSEAAKTLLGQAHLFFPMLMYTFYGVSLALDTKPKSE